jgi:hypothetical protein
MNDTHGGLPPAAQALLVRLTINALRTVEDINGEVNQLLTDPEIEPAPNVAELFYVLKDLFTQAYLAAVTDTANQLFRG